MGSEESQASSRIFSRPDRTGVPSPYYEYRDTAMFRPFQRAETFQKAYITDMIQEMVDLGVPVHCVIIECGWKEIDTVEDYEKALKEFED